MCPAHRDLPTPPTLTLGSTFRIQYHHIPITASRLFHSQHPFRPFSSIGSAFRPHHRRIHITASRLFHSQQPFRPFSYIGSAFRPQHRRIHITVSRLFHSQQPFRPFSSIGSAFRPHHRRIHITASNLFSLSTTLQAVLPHRLSLPHPIPSHTDTSQQNSRTPQPSTPKKKPEGCAEGPRLCGPFAVYLFLKKILCVVRQKSKRHTVF